MARALLIVDFQRDFTPGGALGVAGGDEIATPIEELAQNVDIVFATRDWHPPEHSSFVAQGGPWPPHCVQGTSGAELHPTLDDVPIAAVVDVGQGVDDQGYSGFEGSELARLLRDHEVDEVLVCGIATDYCVRASTLDALREGFGATVVTDAIRPVEVEPGDGQRALEEMLAGGARLMTSQELSAAAD